MKKQTLSILVLSIILFATSCAKKDFTCECTITESDGFSSETRTSSSELKSLTKLEALEECPKSTYTNNGGYIRDEKCELK